MSEADNIRTFFDALGQQNFDLKKLFVIVATRLGIPYEHGRESERLLQTRHEGKWVPSEHGGEAWDSGTDFSDENGPDSFNSVEKALAKIHRPVAMWYHSPSMNLVILDESGAKVGIISTALRIMFVGLHTGNVRNLIDGLQAKLQAS